MAVVGDLTFTIKDAPQVTVKVTSNGAIDGAPVNVSGWTTALVIHAVEGDNTPLFTYAGSVPVGTDGRLVFTIPLADMTTLGVGNFYHYVNRTDPGSEKCLRKGGFEVQAV